MHFIVQGDTEEIRRLCEFGGFHDLGQVREAVLDHFHLTGIRKDLELYNAFIYILVI